MKTPALRNLTLAKTTVTTGTVNLKHGTKYELQVTGTFTRANGFGQAFDEDALYCFGGSGFVDPQIYGAQGGDCSSA